jgi:hypothetical protein
MDLRPGHRRLHHAGVSVVAGFDESCLYARTTACWGGLARRVEARRVRDRSAPRAVRRKRRAEDNPAPVRLEVDEPVKMKLPPPLADFACTLKLPSPVTASVSRFREAGPHLRAIPPLAKVSIGIAPTSTTVSLNC